MTRPSWKFRVPEPPAQDVLCREEGGELEGDVRTLMVVANREVRKECCCLQ